MPQSERLSSKIYRKTYAIPVDSATYSVEATCWVDLPRGLCRLPIQSHALDVKAARLNERL